MAMTDCGTRGVSPASVSHSRKPVIFTNHCKSSATSTAEDSTPSGVAPWSEKNVTTQMRSYTHDSLSQPLHSFVPFSSPPQSPKKNQKRKPMTTKSAPPSTNRAHASIRGISFPKNTLKECCGDLLCKERQSIQKKELRKRKNVSLIHRKRGNREKKTREMYAQSTKD